MVKEAAFERLLPIHTDLSTKKLVLCKFYFALFRLPFATKTKFWSFCTCARQSLFITKVKVSGYWLERNTRELCAWWKCSLSWLRWSLWGVIKSCWPVYLRICVLPSRQILPKTYKHQRCLFNSQNAWVRKHLEKPLIKPQLDKSPSWKNFSFFHLSVFLTSVH